RRETLQRRRAGGGAAEIRALVVSGVLLFVGGEVAEVRLHRRDVRLVLGAGKFRNRDSGKNADDHDDDQKLNERKALRVALHKKVLRVGEFPALVLYRKDPFSEGVATLRRH